MGVYIPLLLTFISSMLSLVFLSLMSLSDVLSEKVDAEVRAEYSEQTPTEIVIDNITLDCDTLPCQLNIPIEDDDQDQLTVDVTQQGDTLLYNGVPINNGDTITYRTEATYDVALGWISVTSDVYPDTVDSINGVPIDPNTPVDE